jgi:hypothetical protein
VRNIGHQLAAMFNQECVHCASWLVTGLMLEGR